MTDFAVGGMSFDRWLKSVGRSRVTGWRWVGKGMISPVNILGKNYITREEDVRFWQRAKAGEFAKELESVEERVRAQGGE